MYKSLVRERQERARVRLSRFLFLCRWQYPPERKWYIKLKTRKRERDRERAREITSRNLIENNIAPPVQNYVRYTLYRSFIVTIPTFVHIRTINN